MKIPRDLATPLTIGAFVIMSVTGTLMFFHLDSGLNKFVHEWAGWAMLVGVILHVVVNWGAFRRYFVASTAGRAIIALGLVVLAGSFVPRAGGEGGGLPPPVLAMKAVANAPISQIAPLTGRPVADLMASLSQSGIALSGPDATIDSVAHGDRSVEAKAMRALFGSR